MMGTVSVLLLAGTDTTFPGAPTCKKQYNSAKKQREKQYAPVENPARNPLCYTGSRSVYGFVEIASDC